MPVQYSGLLHEHRAVRSAAGLFDVSHMGEALVDGAQALEFLQHTTCNNVAKIAVGQAQYTGLINEAGGFVDDLLIYRLEQQRFLLVLNAANTAKDVSWLRRHAESFEVEVSDVSEDWYQVALQGPRAQAILGQLIPQAALESIGYYRFDWWEFAGGRHLVSRTGYTGEDGFEIYGPSKLALKVWTAVNQAGSDRGLLPAGLGARDTLRLEARLALYGNDIDDHTTPIEAGLGWIVKMKKGPFIGREVLERQKRDGVRRKLVGFDMLGRAIGRQGYPCLHDGQEIGRVTSGSLAPSLERRIGLAYLPVELTEEGTRFQIEIRGRHEDAQVVPTPFYKRPV